MQPSKQPPQPPFITLQDSLSVLWARLSLIVATGIACSVAAGAWIWLSPPRYEATASLTMAHVMGEPVESPAVLAEKIKSGTYFSPQAWAACGMADAPDPGRALAQKITPVANRNAPFVSFTLVSPSTALSTSCLVQVVDEVIATQQKLALPVLTTKKTELSELKGRLQILRESDLGYGKLQPASEISNQQFAAQSLWLHTAMARLEASRALAHRITELEIRLTAPLTQSAKLVSPIYAPSIPLGPPPWAVLLAALLIGLALASGFFLLRIQRPRAN